MEQLAAVCKALGNKNRLRILKLLQGRVMCVCEIRYVLRIAQPSVSRHLRQLSRAGLVEPRRESCWIVYSWPRNPANPFVRSVLQRLTAWLDNDPQIVKDRQAARKADRYVLRRRKPET